MDTQATPPVPDGPERRVWEQTCVGEASKKGRLVITQSRGDEWGFVRTNCVGHRYTVSALLWCIAVVVAQKGGKRGCVNWRMASLGG